jgi:hypothetical protein
MRLVTLAIVVAAVLFGVEAAAVQEQQLPYSGVALTPSGAPVADGLHQMEFRLYTGATASEPVWTELQLVQTRSGGYQVVLGQSRPLPLTTGQQYWLEVLCDGASLGRMPLALLPSQAETKVAARSLQELHLNPVQSAAPDGWVRAGLPTLGGATPPQPLVVNTCEECTTTFWALTGNAGTNPNNNFLGTTDNQPLIIRTNNVNRVRITTGGQIEVLNSARSVSLGEGAGISQDLTAFRNNVFVGFQAGSATETGIRNVAVGSGALSQNIDGSSNTALGSNAMSTLTTGDYNTAIGYGAEVGDGLTNATAIGAFAFAGQSNTVVIGSIQGVNGATATANVGIGTTTPMNRLHVVSTADPLRLEGLLVNSALDNVLVVDASGVVKKRSLSGFVGSTAWLLTGNTLSGGEVLGSLNPQPLVLVTNNVERMRITAAGDVGIGTSTPGARLHVVGTGRFDGQLTVTTGGAAITGNSTVTGTLTVSSDVSVGGNLAVTGNATVSGATVSLPNIPALSAATEVLVWNGGNVERRSAAGLISGFAWMLGGNTLTSEQTLGTLSAHDLPIITAGTERVRITQAGDVGIGTSTPGARLDVVNPTGGGVLRLQAVVGQTGALLEWVDDLGNTLGVIDGGGLVGIGTAAPVQKLHVVGNGAVSAVFVEGGVGIGTVNPLATLHVYDEGTLTPGATQVIIQAGANQTGVNLLEWWDNAGTVLGGIDDAGNLFVNTNTTLGDAAGDVVTVYAGTVALPNIPALSTATEVLVWNAGNVERRSAEGLAWLLTGNGGTNPAVNFLGTTDAQPLVIRTNNLERVRITATGNVGIGTNAPAATLDVVGTAQVSGNTSVGGDLTVAGDATVSGTTVALPNIPGGSTATEVLVWNGGNVERRSAAGLISGFAWMLGGNTLTSEQTLGTLSAHDLPIITAGTERVRITQAGDVGIGTSTPGARLDVVNPTGGGVLRLQAVLGQMGALLEWVDETGTPWGVIDNSGLVGIGTATPVQKLHVVGNGAVSAVFVEGGVGVGTVNPLATLHVYDEGTLTPGATQVIIQAGANQTGVNLLEWWDNAGTVLGGIDDAGNLFVNTNTTLGDAAGDVVTVYAGTVALPNIPGGSTATEVLVWNGGNVEHRSASGLISGFAWMLGGNDLTLLGEQTLGTLSAHDLPIITAGTEKVRITQAGDVGIGTSTPGARLHVVGTGRFDGQLTVTAGGAAITGNSTVTGTLTVSSNVSVGGNLTVDGNTTLGDAATDVVTVNAGTVALPNIPGGSTATEVLVWNGGNVEHRSASGLISGFAWMLGGNDLTLLGEQTLGTLSAHDLPIITAGTEKVRITQAGDVGIGTSTPGARLHVVGTGRFDGQLTVTAGGAAITGNSTVTGTLTVSSNVSVGGNLTVDGNTTLGDAATDVVTVNAGTVALPNIPGGSTATEVLVWNGGNVEHRSASGLISGFAWMLGGNDLTLLGEQTLGTLSAHDLPIITAGTEKVRITQAGDVGIGTSTPGARLHVVGTGRFDGQLTVTAGGAAITGNSTVTGTLTVSSNVSVGGNLTVDGSTTLGDAATDVVTVNAGTVALPNIPGGSTATEVLVWNGGNVEHRSASGLISGFAWMLGGNDLTLLGEQTLGTLSAHDLPIITAGTEKVRITQAGDVGIGTSTPGARLHVVGTGRFDGQLTVTAGGAAITGNSTVTGTLTVSSNVSVGGNLTVDGNTTLGDAATDVVTVNAGTVALPNIPGGSTATEVLVWNGGMWSTARRRGSSAALHGCWGAMI